MMWSQLHGNGLESMKLVSGLHDLILERMDLTPKQAMSIAGAFSQLVGDRFDHYTADYVAGLLAAAFVYSGVFLPGEPSDEDLGFHPADRYSNCPDLSILAEWIREARGSDD